MVLTHTEENYLKAIFKITEEDGNETATTNAISAEMSTAAASVTDMLRRLSDKKLINYEKYKGVTLTKEGKSVATALIRKHRLWEYFLVEKLHFDWDEIHDIAEQLEHVNSPELVTRLNDYLGNPRFDPHGDPIPDENGNMPVREQVSLLHLKPGEAGKLTGLRNNSDQLMKYLKKNSIGIGTKITILEHHEFDESLSVKIDDKQEMGLSNKVSKNLLVQTELLS